SAELQRDGMLAHIEADQPFARAEHDRIRCHHLGIESGSAREDAMERPASPVGPVHHRGHAKARFIGSRHGAHIGKARAIVVNGYAAAPRSGRSGRKSTARKASPAITAPTVKALASPAR